METRPRWRCKPGQRNQTGNAESPSDHDRCAPLLTLNVHVATSTDRLSFVCNLHSKYIALGGTIGTGIFLSAGSVRITIFLFVKFLNIAHPAGGSPRWSRERTLVLLHGRLVLLWRRHLSVCGIRPNQNFSINTQTILSGEMAAYIPVTGSFAEFGTRFVSPALGFTLGKSFSLLLFESGHGLD